MYARQLIIAHATKCNLDWRTAKFARKSTDNNPSDPDTSHDVRGPFELVSNWNFNKPRLNRFNTCNKAKLSLNRYIKVLTFSDRWSRVADVTAMGF
jgi:hypothetical protein